MDIATLKYFIVVAQTQHMTAAAQQLNITQPTLSASIRRLESEIGFQLFDRIGRGIRLNEYGKIFLEGVISADSAIQTCLSKMEDKRQSHVHFTRLSCSISSTNSRLVELLLSKGVSLEVDNIPDNWENELLCNNRDLIITMKQSSCPGLSCALLRHQKLAVMASSAHPLAGHKSITMEELSRYPFCSTSSPHSLSSIATEQVRAGGFSPHITFLCRNSADMTKAILSGKYIGLMGTHNLALDKGLILLPVEDFDLSLPIYLYWRISDMNNSVMMSIRQNIIEFYSQDG